MKIIDRHNATFNLYIKMVNAASIERAIKKAPFHIIGDATRAYRKSGSPKDETSLFFFCKDYLERNSGSEQGEGFIVTLKNPKSVGELKVCREKVSFEPYSLSKLDSCYVVYDNDGNEVYVIRNAYDTCEALAEVKRLVNEGVIELNGELTCKFEYRFAKGIPNTVFKIEKTRKRAGYLGQYLLFGIQSIL